MRSHRGGGTTTTGGGIGGQDPEVCEPNAGVWSPLIDWSDPGDPGAETDKPGYGPAGNEMVSASVDLLPIHSFHLPPKPCSVDDDCGITAGCVCPPDGCDAAAIVPQGRCETGRMMMFPGESDQSVWTIDGGGDDVVWQPLPYWETWTDPSQGSPSSDCPAGSPATLACGYPDLFCSGHAQLANGWIFVAGGNVTGSAAQGGLTQTYLFNPYDGDPGSFGGNPMFPSVDPFATDPGTAPYGWGKTPEMAVDRWYPTLTMLPDGRVLIFSGTSRDPAAQTEPNNATRVVEIYDPLDTSAANPYGTISDTGADFPDHAPPSYPYMFVLPTGDVLYVGGDQSQGGLPVANPDDPSAPDYFEGRILRADYNTGAGFAWYSRRFRSAIPGGSAVMFAPGRVLKAGGSPPGSESYTSQGAEILDLSCTGFASPTDCYDAANDFVAVDPIPAEYTQDPRDPLPGRHYHVLTVLPDGRVLMTGGNTADNGRAGDDVDNPCDLASGTPIKDTPCDPETAGTDCPSVCNEINDICALWANISCMEDTDCVDASATCEGEDLSAGRLGRCQITCSVGSGQTPNQVCPDPPHTALASTCTAASGPGHCSRWPVFECSAAGDCPAPDGTPCEDNASCSCNAAGRCEYACDSGSSCPPPTGSPPPFCDPENFCRPANNTCYATRTPVIWDPACGTWSDLGPPEDLDRMYQSTAQLLPNGTVLSTGTGGRGGLRNHPNAQSYAPVYGATGLGAPLITRVVDDDQLADEPFLAYGGSLTLELDDGGIPDEVVLVRIGTVTHAFNYDQRIVTMDVDGSPLATVTWPGGTEMSCRPAQNSPEDLSNPSQCSIAPPGNYLLFALAEGVPSEGVYIRVGDGTAMSYLCAAGPGMQVTEVSCSGEPSNGTCPSAAKVSGAIPLPTVPDASGQQVAGWHVVVNPGMVGDTSNPTSTELAIVEARCMRACEQEWVDNPDASATCSALGAFASPVQFAPDVAPTLDLVRDQDQQGAGLFGSELLTCDVGGSCCYDFDESACVASPRRVTQADDPLQGAEAYRIALGSGSRVTLTTVLGNTSTALSGSVGYSFSRAAKSGATGPFFLGSLNAVAANAVTVKVGCADGSKETHVLSALSLQLAQPAFGVDDAMTDAVAFPIGGLLVEASFDVGREHYRSRRPNLVPVYATAGDRTFSAQGLQVLLTLPCASGSTATVTARFDLVDPADGSALGQPPTASIVTATPVACDGSTVDMRADVSDADGDLAEVRWYVDDVLMSPTTTSVAFTEQHDIKVVARDTRGAVATDERTIKCM